jgi:MFS superfamily sulfate permease-like transporter
VRGAVSEPGLVVYRFGVGLFYANAGRFAGTVTALVEGPEPPRWLVLAADAIDDVDYTGGKTLAEVAQQLRGRGITFAVADAQDAVKVELDRFGVSEIIGDDRYFDTVTAAVEAFHSSK